MIKMNKNEKKSFIKLPTSAIGMEEEGGKTANNYFLRIVQSSRVGGIFSKVKMSAQNFSIPSVPDLRYA